MEFVSFERARPYPRRRETEGELGLKRLGDFYSQTHQQPQEKAT
jgi:hypothetical protein